MTVKQRQALLFYLGYYTGALDGDWGKGSRAGCQAFQRDYGLTADGLGGPVTDKALVGAVAGTMVPVRKPQSGQEAAEAPAWWKDIKYFRREESGIRCPCGRCGGFPVEPTERLMRTADSIREELGPMTPSSTVRCQEHNDELTGSAKNSYHLTGRAMDFTCRKSRNAQVEACLSRKKAAGEIRYWYSMGGGWYHFDVY